MGLSIALRISKITKRKRARFCSILIETIRSCLGQVKNCPNIQGKIFLSNIYQKCGTYRRKTWRAWLLTLKFCTEANQTLLFKRLQNNFFNSRPLHGANISQIFPFTKTKEPHNIQLVPNIWSTSFHQPVKIWIGLSCWCLFSTCPQIYIKSESYFPNISLGKWEQRSKYL